MADASTEAVERAMWSGASNILVVVRCRPLSEKERRVTDDVVNVVDGKIVVVKDPGHHANNIMRAKRVQDRKWAFDHAFGPETSQSTIYSMTTAHLIEGVANGFNATCFAYGQTGTCVPFRHEAAQALTALCACSCFRVVPLSGGVPECSVA